MKKGQMELLSPAGSFEGMMAAFGAGADAVYAGGTQFGARAYARNFDSGELLEAIRVTHILGKKFYLTVNTLQKNHELEEKLYGWLEPLVLAGLDAVLVQDLGVLRYIRRCFPTLPVHASTQMAVTGHLALPLLKELGVVRVVPARELSLDEIRAMTEADQMEVEVFIHGAMCYSFSGMCLLSSLLGGRSGNRGRCAQPCRLPYKVTQKPGRTERALEETPLSMKDLIGIDLLPELADAGVASLKIEGRMKQPEYTAGVTGIYRKYLDLLASPGKKYTVLKEDREALLDLFSRGRSEQGYYHRHNGPEMISFSNDRKTEETHTVLCRPKRMVDARLRLAQGEHASLELSAAGSSPAVRVSVTGDTVEPPRTRPVTAEQAENQISRLGDTLFSPGSVTVDMSQDVFVPVSSLNRLRREAVAALEAGLAGAFARESTEINPPDRASAVTVSAGRDDSREKRLQIYASCEAEEQVMPCIECRETDGLYLPPVLMKKYFEAGRAAGKKMYLSFPYIVRDEAGEPKTRTAQIKKFLEDGGDGILVRSLEGWALACACGAGDRCVIDHTLYTWNDEAVSFWLERDALRITAPAELNEKELLRRNSAGGELLVYGNLPVMISAQCTEKNCFGCSRSHRRNYIHDRYGKCFISQCVCRPWEKENAELCESCYNIIYNSVPYTLKGILNRALRPGYEAVRLSFTVESAEETKRILGDFCSVLRDDGSDLPMDEGSFTRGHFKRGVE